VVALAGLPVDDRQLLAGVVDEALLAGLWTWRYESNDLHALMDGPPLFDAEQKTEPLIIVPRYGW